MKVQQNNISQLRKGKFSTIWSVVIIALISGLVVGGGVYYWQELKIQKIKMDKTVDLFPVYGADKNCMVIEINFYIKIPKSLAMIEKLKIIADKLSRFEFSHLPIEVLKIERKTESGKRIAIINLKEYEWNQEILRNWKEEWTPETGKIKLSKIVGNTWRFHYFQGSTGGGFTSATLTETFLQREYDRDWIDGVEFYYEGTPISDEWDHISLGGTIYRKTKQK